MYVNSTREVRSTGTYGIGLPCTSYKGTMYSYDLHRRSEERLCPDIPVYVCVCRARIYLCTTIGTTPARHLLSSVTRYIPVPNYIDVHFGYERVLQINYNLGL